MFDFIRITIYVIYNFKIIWAKSDGSYYIADKKHSPKSEYQDFKKFTPRRKNDEMSKMQ